MCRTGKNTFCNCLVWICRYMILCSQTMRSDQIISMSCGCFADYNVGHSQSQRETDLCIALLLSEGESRQISARGPLRNCEGFIRRTLRLMIVAGARQSTCKSAVWLHKCHRLYKGLCGVSAESIVSEQRRDRENKLWIPQ